MDRTRLATHYTLLVINHAVRVVYIAGTTSSPNHAFMDKLLSI